MALVGLLILCILYAKIWQQYFWNRFENIIQQAIQQGWQVRPTGISPKLVLYQEQRTITWSILYLEEQCQIAEPNFSCVLPLDSEWDDIQKAFPTSANLLLQK